MAVIGAGMAGRAHASGYRSAPTVFGGGLPGVRLVAIADAYEPFATDTAQRYGYERAETSWEAIGVARETAARAHAWLAQHGYVVTVPGVGMVVTPPERWKPDE